MRNTHAKFMLNINYRFTHVIPHHILHVFTGSFHLFKLQLNNFSKRKVMHNPYNILCTISLAIFLCFASLCAHLCAISNNFNCNDNDENRILGKFTDAIL